MADFPTTPHTFTPFANGATSDAAQATDIYNEVEAIEAGYLNGTARLNSSNSTVANLSVTGGSTFTGAVVFSSLVRGTAQPRCLVYSTAAQSFAADAFTAITFESEEFDVGGLHSTASNPGRITIPAGSSGLYLFGTTVRLSTGGSGQVATVRISKNSTTEVAAAATQLRSSLASIMYVVTHPVVADGTDYFESEVFPTTSTGSIGAATVRRQTSEFWCVKLW